MRISSEIVPVGGGGVLTLYAAEEEGDGPPPNAKHQFGRPGAAVAMDDEGFTGSLHPDLYGLVTLLVFGAFTRTLRLDTPVSSRFAEVVGTHLGHTIEPQSEAVPERLTPADGTEAVAFSGGVDSCAALFLTPGERVAIFLDRVNPTGVTRSLYRPDAARDSCRAVTSHGHVVKMIPASTEYARNPVGFAFDWSNAVPAIVHADQLRIRSIGFGMVLESAFSIGHPRYSDLTARGIYKNWAPVFRSVGLHISLPTAGLSEVVTSRLAAQQFPHWLPQSCVRGASGTPCGSCFKCFRKQIMEASIAERPLAPGQLDRALGSREVRRRLLETPIHHEDGLAFSLGELSYEHPAFLALRKKTDVMRTRYGGLEFLNRYFPPALNLVPEFIRDDFQRRLEQFVEPMTPVEERTVREWNLDAVVGDPAYEAAHEGLASVLGAPG